MCKVWYERFDPEHHNDPEKTFNHIAELQEYGTSYLLPEVSEMKEDQVTEKMELELKLRKLTKAGNKLGSEAILVRESEMDLLERQITGLDAFIGFVTTRRYELPTGS